MRYLLIFMLMLSVVGCTTKKRDEESWRARHRELHEKPTEDLTFAVEKFVTQLKYEKRLYLENALICDKEDGPLLEMNFITQNIMEMCEARQLLVDVVEGLLYNLNSYYIEPSERPYPYSADNLKIEILFESYERYIDPYYIGWVVLEDGEAYYYANTVKNRQLNEFSVRTEPYFKSKSIALAQRQAEQEWKLAHPPKPANPFDADRFIEEGVTPR